MTDNKKFLIISLVTSIIYCILGAVFMILQNLDTVSVVLFALIVLVAATSSVLCWKIMRDQNKLQGK